MIDSEKPMIRKIMEYMFHLQEVCEVQPIDVPIFFTTGTVTEALHLPHPSVRRIMQNLLRSEFINKSGKIVGCYRPPTETQMFDFLKRQQVIGRKITKKNKVIA